MSNRLAIDPSEIRLSDPRAIRRRLWGPVTSSGAPVVKKVVVDFGFDTPVDPVKTIAPKPQRKPSIDVKKVARALRDSIDAWIQQYEPISGDLNTARSVVIAVASRAGLAASDLTGPSYARKARLARQEAMYELRARFPDLSLFQIGGYLGDRDHSTIRHGIEAHAARFGLSVPESKYQASRHVAKEVSPAVRS